MQDALAMRNGLVFYLLFLFACASGKSTGPSAQDDAGQNKDANALHAFGEACKSNEQCRSGICLGLSENTDGWCSQSCDEKCPDGFACGIQNNVALCLPAVARLCSSCQADPDCGGGGNFCIASGTGNFCASACTATANSCPTGFTCTPTLRNGIPLGSLCISDGGSCCIDADGDFRGQGDECRGSDCDDSDIDIYSDALELCDGKDNNCSGEIDINITDCAKAQCRLSSSGYVMQAAETCMGASCVEQPEVLCGTYTCNEGGEEGETCATSCNGEDDLNCADSAHCDNSLCVTDFTSGSVCNEDSDCSSEHCQNGFCCGFGDCCQSANDCPGFGTFEPVCDAPNTCQGTRGASVCSPASTCTTTGEQENDSACTSLTIANDCGFYLPIFCNGQNNQSAPSCPTSCQNNQDCDAGAFCDASNNTCVEDVEDGAACSANSQCLSDHCQNGFCCGTGDCCESASDCPDSYASEPSCITPSTCQGQGNQAICDASQCSTLLNAPDDSACGVSTLADGCGPYHSVRCNGDIVQETPLCDSVCANNSECSNNAYCNAQNQCEYDELNGQACNEDNQCQSGHCANGYCCDSGDCCANAEDCSPLDISATCNSQGTCQGTRTDGVCGANFQCSTTEIDDDSACEGLPANDCGPYPSTICTSAQSQPANQASLCPDNCAQPSDCDASANCNANTCEPGTGQGSFCNGPSDCSGGLECIDNICCNSSCPGTCQACDIDGSTGSCSSVPQGQDPDAECGPIDCAGYYFGWQGSSCYQKANLSAASATCGGGTSCASTNEECTAQTLRGPEITSCDTTCQSPDLASCLGNTIGTCNNLNLGTETCGQGVCAVTSNRCESGTPQTCTPNAGAATSETCDGLDNDCNGSIDDALSADSYEANNSCSANYFLGTLDQGNSASFNDMTLYTAGDEDWYRQRTSEDLGTCTAGIDEEYRYTLNMTPPSGKDYDLQLCYNNYSNSSCSTNCFSSVGGGDRAESIVITWKGPCGGGGNDGLNMFIRVYPYQSANSCEPYTLSTLFEKTN